MKPNARTVFPTVRALVYAVDMTDQGGTFRITRYAAGTLVTTTRRRVFPVTVQTAPLAYQVKRNRKWVTVATMNTEAADKARAHQAARNRPHGKDWRIVAKPAKADK